MDSKNKDQIADSILDLIGNTPLLNLSRIYNGSGRLLGKCEFMNPTGSLKDRSALTMVEEAEKAGLIGDKIFEVTSGNQGSSLAMVASVKKKEFTAIMSKGNSVQRRIMMNGLGAKVILVDQINGVPGSITEQDNEAIQEYGAQYYEEHPDEYFINQGGNYFNVYAHYKNTGPEIWRQTDGKISAFLMVIGTSGTLIGVSKFLKEMNPKIKCFCVEPEGCEGIKGTPITKPMHLLEGSSYGFVPPLFDYKYIDGTIAVSENEVLEARKRLALEEGLSVGFTAAANVAASIKLLKFGMIEKNSTVVTILCDTGLKYSS